MDQDALVVVLETEDGKEQEFEVYGTFGVEEQDYMALIPAGEGSDREVFLVGFHAGENDEIVFDPIPDDETYSQVSQVFDSLFNGDGTGEQQYDMTETYQTEMDQVDRLMEDLEEQEEYCYQDDEGRLYLYDEQGNIVYLDEYGEPILGEEDRESGENPQKEDQKE